ncbi:DUF427 domain-containing protein [Candidatus Saccharibacteria bacterium]|nr:DUF427 domain-containing protein [Candidatus Saccharibacteria bacterium]
MKAEFNGTVIAQAPKEELIYIEGNWYFPPDRITREYFAPSDLHTICPWKGEASYYDVSAGGQTSQGGAWYYPEPKAGALTRVGQDFGNYVAFWRGVTVSPQ